MSTLADRPVVLDASVVVKLVLVEELTSTAWRLYEDAFARDRSFVVPALLANEVTNAIYRQFRRGLIGESMADQAVEALPNLGILLTSPPTLVQDAYAFAKHHPRRRLRRPLRRPRPRPRRRPLDRRPPPPPRPRPHRPLGPLARQLPPVVGGRHLARTWLIWARATPSDARSLPTTHYQLRPHIPIAW